MKARMDSQFGTEQRFFMADDSFSSFSDFFKNLTRIDILSFEPAFNQVYRDNRASSRCSQKHLA
jgi:hypothetical protein